MNEDNRMARDGREPQKTDAAGNARWAAYLDWMRESLAGKVLELSPIEQRTSRLPSGWTPIELLNHVWHMEQRWLVWGFLGEQVDLPWGDWNRPEPWTSDDSDETVQDARWHVDERVTAAQVVEHLRQVGGRTSEVLRDFPLDATAAPGGRFAEDPPTLEWICFHVLAEYAQHVGHIDIAVELAQSAPAP